MPDTLGRLYTNKTLSMHIINIQELLQVSFILNNVYFHVQIIV